ncbi:MAG: YidC/Oxa1 family membrane protein insertase [Clostridiales bacterium]|uniref:YidC/Oxa1 family membrane protein insertase n=1 Tax=Flavonifractor porci TaxID=3133422 RepID=UPI0030A0C90A|nr:YidC/Oxa1 family membrane protein insertase [Clostridiales bacterium]
MEIILSPFAWLLKAFYSFCGSYGLALIFFALVVKVVLFPLSLKGKRSMIQMNILQGQMQKLQKQYGKDRQRYNLEVQKLYEKEKVNPMGGCLWSFIPLIILMILYPIIREPIHYMMGINDANSLNAIAQAVDWSTQAVNMGWIKEAADTFTNSAYNQLYLASLINENNLAAVQQAVTAAGGVGANVFSINFSLFGLVDLSQIPQLQFWTITGGLGLFLLPVISAVSGVFFSFISMKTNAINKQSAQAANNGTAKTMLIISPLISLWIGFTLPAALCMYWIANNLLSMIQEFLCSRILKKDYEEAARRQAERELQEKEEEKEERRRKAEERARRIEEEKLNKGKKKKAEKKHEDEEKIPGVVKEYSRVGLRQYARGRAYDPYRYSEDGPTCYPGEEPVFGKKPEQVVPAEEESVQETAAVEEAPALEAAPQVDASAADVPAAGDGETKE